MSSINLTLRSGQDWSGATKARELVEALVSAGDFWVPEKLDNREPERFPFDTRDLSNLMELWTSEISWVYLKRRKPHPVWLVLRTYAREQQRLNELAGGVDERYFKTQENVSKTLDGARRLYEWGAMTHGFVCHEQDWKEKNYLGVPTRLPSGKTTSTGGLWLDDGLPGVYWANFFGPTYVDFFGADRFRSVPAYRKEQLRDGGYLLQTASGPLEYTRPEERTLEQKMIDHLGRDAFFDRANPQARTRAPRFAFNQAGAGQPLYYEVVAIDHVVEAIPDVKRFLADVPTLAQALGKRMRTDLSFTPDTLGRVDNFIVKRSRTRREAWTQPEGRLMLQELTAYFGEVLRRNLGGRWQVAEGSSGDPHPAIALPADLSGSLEYPFARVLKLFSGSGSEGSQADGLAVHYHLLATGQLRRAEQSLPDNRR